MLILSTEGAQDLATMNPFCGPAEAEKILRLVADAMLHVIRIGQTRRVLSSTKELYDRLLDLSQNHGKHSGVLQDLSLRAADVARSLGVKRCLQARDIGNGVRMRRGRLSVERCL